MFTTDFTAAPTQGGAPLSVTFTNLTLAADGNTTYLWDFGDGQTSVEANPVHIYTVYGDYSKELKILGEMLGMGAGMAGNAGGMSSRAAGP